MSAETLRKAAGNLRELAAAHPLMTVSDPRIEAVWLNSARYLAITPAVALAVADWLDDMARWSEVQAGTTLERVALRRAVVVARAYLGEA